MKRKIFELLMGIRAEIIKATQTPEQHETVAPASSKASVDSSRAESVPEVVASEVEYVAPPTIIRKAISTPPETRYFTVMEHEIARKIAYTVSGDMEADNILVCLPGLLETKSSFMVIHAYFLKFENCKVISVDLSGRGESDYLKSHVDYKMSIYLSDMRQFIQGLLLSESNPNQRITILGTSMGGVLAMYLTQLFGKKIYGIVLNDIALTVNWTSLYALYKSMKNELGFREVRELAKDLSVDEKAISDVQLPGHFDLSYQADIWGMNFHEALAGYQGKVGLIYGAKSKICTKQRVDEAKTFLPQMQVLEVADAGHPAPFNLLVCDFIQNQMGV